MWPRLPFWLIGLAAIGCSQTVEPEEPPFKLSPPIPVVEAPALSIRIVEPAAALTKKPRERVDVVVELTLPPGKPLPTFFMVAYMRGNVDNSSFGLEAKEQHGNTYVFAARTKTPPRPGKFLLRADAMYLAGYEEGGELKKKEGDEATHHVYSPGVPVEVVP